jgi:hypothetical protein
VTQASLFPRLTPTGVPRTDFEALATECRKILGRAGITLTHHNIRVAVSDNAWQSVRAEMLGTTIRAKWASLDAWITGAVSEDDLLIRPIQVLNYIHALKRGGLL